MLHDCLHSLTSTLNCRPTDVDPYRIIMNLLDSCHYRRSPHDPERVREMPQEVPELLEPVPVCPRPAPLPENFFHYGSRPESLNEADYATRDEILATDQGLSRNSILNVRYTKRQAPAPPGVSSSPPPRAVSPPPRRPAPLRPQGRPMTPPRHLSPIPSISAVGGFLNFAETEASSGINTEIEAALAPNRLNQRYAASRSSIPNGSLPPRGSLPNGSLPNGSVQNGQTEEEMYRHYTQYATSIPSENANVKYLYCSSQHCQRRFFFGYIVVADT